MTAWLAMLISDICAAIIQKLGGDISSYVKAKQAQAANVTAAQDSVQPLKNATTGQEEDNAASSTLGGT